MIRLAKQSDAQQISDIYNDYVLNTTITYEEEPVSFQEMAERIRKISASYPFVVFEKQGAVVGYAYASKWKERSAYRFTVETTVYLKRDEKGQGLGTSLYKYLLDELRKMDVHSAVGVLDLPNDASVALHEKLGFEKVGHLAKVGYKFNQWLDIGIWQYNFKESDYKEL